MPKATRARIITQQFEEVLSTDAGSVPGSGSDTEPDSEQAAPLAPGFQASPPGLKPMTQREALCAKGSNILFGMNGGALRANGASILADLSTASSPKDASISRRQRLSQLRRQQREETRKQTAEQLQREREMLKRLQKQQQQKQKTGLGSLATEELDISQREFFLQHQRLVQQLIQNEAARQQCVAAMAMIQQQEMAKAMLQQMQLQAVAASAGLLPDALPDMPDMPDFEDEGDLDGIWLSL